MDELLALLGYLHLRVIHRARFLRLEFAVDMNEVAGFVVALHVGHIPPTAMESSRAIVNDELEQTLAKAHPLDARRDNRPGDGGIIALGQSLNLVLLVTVLVAPWPVPQQVGDGPNAELGQARRALNADTGQRRHLLANGICHKLGHFDSCTGNLALGQASRRFTFR